ncbi:MAG: hypothetical protein AB7D33_10030 [Sphingobium sp.]
MMITRKIAFGSACALVASSLLFVGGTAEARQGVIKARGTNGVVTAVRGPNGTTGARARGTVRNEDGSLTRASGGAWRNANGGTSVRGATTTVNPDGSGTRTSNAYASGAKGTASSSGTLSRDAEGNWTGNRNSTATNAATGNSYSGSVSIDPATGQPVRTATCTDASGAVIACPR